MATPSINNFIRYINKKLSGSNWNTNLQKIISFLTDGTYDFNVNSLNTTNDITSGRDITAVGNITANKFIGDGSDITGLNEWRNNFIINGSCLIKNNPDYTLVKDQYGTSVDRFDGMATGTLVSAGTLIQTTTANCGKTGYAIKFNQVTLTGAGTIYLRHRLYNKSAVNFKNSLGSFSMKVWHNVINTLNYTIYLNKANSLNDFTTVTEINNSGGLGVLPSTATQLKYENVSLGDCSNGLEILIKVECGDIILKDFEFSELQLELGNTTTEFEYRNLEMDSSYNLIDKNSRLILYDDNDNYILTKDKINISGELNAIFGSGICSNSSFNLTGSSNSIFGNFAGSYLSSTETIGNCLFGNFAGYIGTGYGYCTFLGYQTGRNNTADYNTFVGSQAGYKNTTGVNNTFIGYESGYENTTGINNTLIGFQANVSKMDKSYLTVVGSNAGAGGNKCTYIGYGSGGTGGITANENNICLGYEAEVPNVNGSNQVRIGDANITYAGIQVAWTVTSDKRFKEDIKDLNLGLNFINNLRPVEYKRIGNERNEKEFGLIAQEVEELLNKEKISNISLLSKDSKDYLSIKYNDLIPVLIKSVQELSFKVKFLEDKINGNTIN